MGHHAHLGYWMHRTVFVGIFSRCCIPQRFDMFFAYHVRSLLRELNFAFVVTAIMFPEVGCC